MSANITEEIVLEGKLRGVFTGFRNYDTCFRFQSGGLWRQDEYLYTYHKINSPMAKIIRVVEQRATRKESFYIEVQGVPKRVKVRPSYD